MSNFILDNFTETRIQSKFLWFPKKLKGELKWLVKANWEQARTKIPESNCSYFIGSHNIMVWTDWVDIKWID